LIGDTAIHWGDEARRTMEKELHCVREASHYLPSVAFTAQDIRHIPTTNSTRWYQLWAQSQHAYSNKTIAEKN